MATNNIRNKMEPKPNKDRDKQSIGRSTPMNNQNAMPYNLTYSYGQTPGIVQGDGADWFGPLNPMVPTAPPEVEGRRFDFPTGYNLVQIPRAYEAVSFGEMRALADAYDILRLVIETRKDQMEKLSWVIKPKSRADGTPVGDPKDKRIDEITTFLERPDRNNDWGQWLRSLLEDLLVIDAPSLYCHETRGGQLLGLEQLDGGTIKRVIDDWGNTPEAPTPAYQQVLKGLPAVDYTADQLIYFPRNTRVHKVYGYSPVEQVIMTVNIALRRQLFQLNYYTDGNIPEALVGTPDAWTPKQVQDFQDSFDAMLNGNLAMRRRLFFVPGGVGKTFIPTKEPELTGQMDVWLAKIVSFAFSISAQWIESKMNRATAETAQDAALEEGLAPIMAWVTRLVNFIIYKYWPDSNLEFAWQEEDEVDQNIQSQILQRNVDSGIMRANEAREVLGLAPDPLGNDLRIKTGSGAVKLDAPDKAAERAQQTADALSAGGSVFGKPPAGGKPGEEDDAASASPGDPQEGDGTAQPDDKAADDKGGDAEKASGTFRKRKRTNYYAKLHKHLAEQRHEGHSHDTPHKGSAAGRDQAQPQAAAQAQGVGAQGI